jgi:hypothetical protein
MTRFDIKKMQQILIAIKLTEKASLSKPATIIVLATAAGVNLHTKELQTWI